MPDWVSAGFLLASALFMLLAAVGILRLPDLYTRMSATSKAAGLGSGLALLAVAIHFSRLEVTTRAAAAILFVFMTVPVAAHMVGRAGYLIKVPISDRTRYDELAGQYDRRTHQLEGRSGDSSATPIEATTDSAPTGHQEDHP
jgi:multicomponent Na+:H+ antiporter subunit G